MSDDKLPKWVKPLLEFGPVIAFFVAYMRMKETVYTIAGSDYQGFIVVTALFVPLLLLRMLPLLLVCSCSRWCWGQFLFIFLPNTICFTLRHAAP